MNTMAPPQMPPKAQPKTMAEMLESFRVEADNVERALAGYTCMTDLIRQVQQGTAEGERVRGRPILNYKATVDGVHAVDVRVDLGKLDPHYVPNVLSPMAHIHGAEMHEALQLMYRYAGQMLAEVEAALGITQEPPAAVQQEPHQYDSENPPDFMVTPELNQAQVDQHEVVEEHFEEQHHAPPAIPPVS